MSNNEWEVIGKSIVDLVETAVDSKEFRQLNQTLVSTVASAAKEVGKGFNKVQESIKEQEAKKASLIHKDNRKYFIKANSPKSKGILLMIFGYMIAVSCGFSFIPMLAGTVLVPGMSKAAFVPVFLGTMALIGLVIALRGTSLFHMVKRFQAYINGLNGKSYVNIEDLLSYVNKEEKYVVKDLKKMIKKKWFIEGHLDHENKSLMITHETYNEYLRTLQQAKEIREYEEQISPEVREVLSQGNKYILEIRRCNDAIPGEEISNKIDRIESVVRKIFNHIEQHPENINDIRKFIRYYLPTTIKLLKAYEELDQQTIQGENIKNSKKEIEKTLDTLNVAFEKLLDDLFLDTAWDVSSDISVLNTMLVQEGLKDSGIK